jgi:hypothetical protein
MLLNPNLKVNKVSKTITVVDNIFKDYVLNILRLRMQLADKFDHYYKEYKSISYGYEDSLTNDLAKEISKKFKLDKFKTAWSFIYDNNSKGVDFHADPSNTNVNVWVTPNESIEDNSKNGLLICDVKPPKKWTREQYNGNLNNCVDKFLKKQNYNMYKIEYRYNRAIFFNGALFHKTDDVRTKDGIYNKRVSYTMLFGKQLEWN